MKPQSHGNGSGKVNIHTQDMGGWIRVFTDPGVSLPDDIAVGFSLCLTEWFRQHPNLRLRCMVAIDREGNTVELHAWYDAHLFNSTVAGPQPSGPGPG